MTGGSRDLTFPVCDIISASVSLSHLSMKSSKSLKHHFLHSTQAEIAAQKNRGLTPIKKVCPKLIQPSGCFKFLHTTVVDGVKYM